MRDFTKAGVAIVPPYLAPRWDAEAAVILDTLDSYHRHAASYREITGLDDGQTAATLRDDLRSVAPSMAAFVDHLLAALQAGGCAAYVPKLGIGAFEPDRRARLLYALAALIGRPSPTDAREGRILWDVTPRPTAGDYDATFSEHDGEAAFHTDTQYYPVPERWIALYVMTPAGCGGGLSVLCDGEAVRDALDCPETRWALHLLESQPLPFRVPSLFTTDRRPGAVQATIAPIFSICPGIRYRRDTLLDGWSHFPEYRSRELEDAVRVLEAELAGSDHAVRFAMPRDSLLVADNHRALHARTGFTDRRRHLLRVRMQGDEPRSAAAFPMLTRLRATALAAETAAD